MYRKGDLPESNGSAEVDKVDGSRNPFPVPEVPLNGVGGGNIIPPGPPIKGVPPLNSVVDPGPDKADVSRCCSDDIDCG